jgi:hypothetical protein
MGTLRVVSLATMSLGVFAAFRALPGAEDCCISPVQLGFSTASVSSPAPFDGIVESVPGTCSGGGAFILGYLFLGGSPPPPPYPECDEDGTCRPSSLFCYVDQPGCR